MRKLLLPLVALTSLPILLGAAMKPVPRPPEVVAVIGTGRVGAALGPQFAKLGHRVVYGSRDPGSDRVKALVAKTGADAKADSPPRAAAGAQIIVLAVPWKATEDTVKALGDLSGKTLIDATNPLKFGPGPQIGMAVETSGGELIQGWAPQAKVVKAFNAVGYSIMADPTSAGGPVTIPLAGDDAAAKKRVADLVEHMGFETVDVGTIRNARYLEGMAILYITPYMSGRPQDGFEYHLRKRAAPLTGPVRPAG
jgi:predicted dinucleotide-binding enzyme